MDWSWLALLLCPLMMVPMMFMMRGNHSDHKDRNEDQLTRELNALKEQNGQMLQEIQQLKQQKG
ncbi:DUF2933 domain-containing protein [Cohnella massiliensis]|uniref:DUF2933 domain-containing protein n=1 Tax=Cohnella massiliensis TaxID=1816691 RepID=UPI0009BA9C00|nr:DUF2933 domain-containing protein [Cohnella massiliensis]